MKKILSILVLALFVISLSACTEPEDDDNTNNNNNNDDPKTDVPDDIGDPPSDMVDTSENLKNDV
ncbi:MAG: hypothetical protein ACLFUQ_07010, partial [Candidatus Izemoplasmataceae bacterium]